MKCINNTHFQISLVFFYAVENESPLNIREVMVLQEYPHSKQTVQ